SIFKNSKAGRILRYSERAAEKTGRPIGSVLTIEFEIESQKFVALNGGPLFKFNESISFVVNCETQEEVDYFWEKLTADGGEESACGWLKEGGVHPDFGWRAETMESQRPALRGLGNLSRERFAG